VLEEGPRRAERRTPLPLVARRVAPTRRNGHEEEQMKASRTGSSRRGRSVATITMLATTYNQPRQAGPAENRRGGGAIENSRRSQFAVRVTAARSVSEGRRDGRPRRGAGRRSAPTTTLRHGVTSSFATGLDAGEKMRRRPGNCVTAEAHQDRRTQQCWCAGSQCSGRQGRWKTRSVVSA